MSLRLGASRARDLPQPSTYARSWPHLTQQTRSGRRRRRWNRIQRHTSRRRHRRRNGGQRLHPWRRVRINCDLAPLDCLGAQLTHESRKIRIRYGVMMRSRFSGASKVSCRVNRATAQDGRRRDTPAASPDPGRLQSGPEFVVDSGVFVQSGSKTFKTKPVSIVETGRSLMAAVAAGNVKLPRFVSN